ncbi:MAG TPA: hypothetical protein VFR43_09820 [Gaiellaceae bacterium]|jgi:hypothetical protein|nr:hypothetical protein [Gaiellaceae bacterium]
MSAVPEQHEPTTARPTWVSDDALANLIEAQRRSFRGDVRRVVVRLVGEDEIEVGRTQGREAAVALAREVSEKIRAANAAGVWPEVEGRHLRPDAIVSVDIQRVE